MGVQPGRMESEGELSPSESEIERRPPLEEPNRFGSSNQGHVISTYRYLRLAIVTVIVTLLVSLLLERAHASCWNGSVSAYYYTPVHSIFVAALGVIGVALVAIRGGSPAEEALLNAAGFLAPVVAFVPTGWSSMDCPSNLTDTSKKAVDRLLSGDLFFAKFSANNLVAFVVGGLCALLITVILVTTIARAAGGKAPLVPPAELLVPALGSAAVVIAGFIWHDTWPNNFNIHAHSYSAILMFALVGIVIILTAIRDESKVYTALYFACAGAMVAGFAGVFIAGTLVTWRHEVLILEGIEATAFVVFWFLQTIQLWDDGLAVPASSSPSPTRRTRTGS